LSPGETRLSLFASISRKSVLVSASWALAIVGVGVDPGLTVGVVVGGGTGVFVAVGGNTGVSVAGGGARVFVAVGGTRVLVAVGAATGGVGVSVG